MAEVSGFRVVSNGGELKFFVSESDGSVGEVDLLEAADVLAARGAACPRSRELLDASTVDFGELVCSDEVQFFRGDVEVPTEQALAVLADGLYAVLVDAVNEAQEAAASPPRDA
jgi:hypothetical protein